MTKRNSVVRHWAYMSRTGLLATPPVMAPRPIHSPDDLANKISAITINQLFIVPDSKVQPCSMPLLVGGAEVAS